jgi:hypothetical protein
MTTHGILRGESVYKCELSDLFGVNTHKKDVDPHACYVLMMSIATGKTNGYIKLYGRVARHKDAKLCAVGALGFYLLYRFEKTKEFESPPDFSDNNSWFDWKLLCDMQRGEDNAYSKAIKDTCYAKTIREACRQLQISTCHFLHIGRVLGHHAGEENDDSQEDLRILGNWDPSTQDKYYSKQMPMKIIKSRAGFVKADHYHFNPRTAVMPPANLQKMIFPWIEEAKDQLLQKDPLGQRRTALAFLSLMEQLRVVILQDAAVLMDDQNRFSHQLFVQLDVFSSVAFQNFRREMRDSLPNLVDPSSASVSAVLPGVKERLDRIGHDLSVQTSVLTGCARTCDDLGRFVHGLNRDVHQLRDGVYQRIEAVDHTVGNLATKMYHAASAFTGMGQENNVNGSRLPLHNVGVGGALMSPGRKECVPLAPRPTAAAPQGDHPPNSPGSSEVFKIPEKWKSLEDVLDFWKQVESMEAEQKSRWRKNFTDAKRKMFSRLKIVCTTVNERISTKLSSEDEIHRLLTVDSRGSLCALEKLLKKRGWYTPANRQKKACINPRSVSAPTQMEAV